MPSFTSTPIFKWLYFFIGAAVLLNFSGLFITILGLDGPLYACIAKSMVQRHDYVNLFSQGKDWLDKPHFPFWVTALSFNLFGFTTWAYKLPAILFVLMGGVYTYLFCKNLYNKEVALWSVLIFLTAEHLIISNNDVRAEPYLTGLIIASVYHFYKTVAKNSIGHLIIACVFAACAVMTKGIFALIPIFGAFAGEYILTKNWKQLFNWRWLLAFILVMLFLASEIYCLYEQFDLHPEKLVFDQHNVSGIKFFFWDSQFGRFFNNGPIKGHGDPFFFFHTLLWAFIPWSVLLYIAVVQFFRNQHKQKREWYCICGALLTFFVFSASKFQLPHYITIVFPFFAIITAQYLIGIKTAKGLQAIRITQSAVLALLILIVLLLQYFYRAENFTFFTILLLLITAVLLIFVSVKEAWGSKYQLLFQSVLVSIFINLYLNLNFYPSLLHYQSGSEAAFYIDKNSMGNLPVAQLQEEEYSHALEFYLNRPLYLINEDGKGNLPSKPYLLYASKENINQIVAKGWKIRPVKTFNDELVTRLTGKFLNRKTRKEQLGQKDLVLVEKDVLAK
ncbi:ArnT family glycosyltransferase [Mucilaginibacter arboris]|uniref:Phospholipid carrier-dependent glycosyltransferase n=1 Tax=Mucilaginibacter arboris TaxID=2682090 RepID=A0A7K1SS70_9SPHI|nr:glycosyltransferase family 39 protein [Mucilaginibacter arboris]MVN20084.1 phospholipid carrier-dependent glycosyltransferase [Mucilaginibacter arboris]